VAGHVEVASGFLQEETRSHMCDLVVRGVAVVDGTGGSAYSADVAVAAGLLSTSERPPVPRGAHSTPTVCC
jgi:hypothetical protein